MNCTVLSSSEGFSASCNTVAKEVVDTAQVEVDARGVCGGRFVATKNGFTVVALESTGKGKTMAGLVTEGDKEEPDTTATEEKKNK